MTENTTGQVDDPSLSVRMKADALKKKESLSLAEKLILASTQETFSYTYKGVAIDVKVPTQGELNGILGLFKKWVKPTGEETTDEEIDSFFMDLCTKLEPLFVDESITVELLHSETLGTSFIPKFINEVVEQEKRTSEEVTAIKGFRKK